MRFGSRVRILLSLLIAGFLLILPVPPVSAQDYVFTVHEGDTGIIPTVNESFPGVIGAYYNIPYDFREASYGHYFSITFNEDDDSGLPNTTDPFNWFPMSLGYEDITAKESGTVYFYMPVVPGDYSLTVYQANPNPNTMGNIITQGYTTYYEPFSDVYRSNYYVTEGPATFANVPVRVRSGESLAVSVGNISSPVSWIGLFPTDAKTFEDCLYAQFSHGPSATYDYLPANIAPGQYCLKVVSYILGHLKVSTSQSFEVMGNEVGVGALQPNIMAQIADKYINRDLKKLLLPERIALTVQGDAAANKLTWSGGPSSQNMAGLVGYHVYKSTQPGQQTDRPETDLPIEDITYTDTKITPGSTYYYIVKPVFADNSIGAASNEVSAATPGSTAGNTGNIAGNIGSIVFTIGKPLMSSNGVQKAIDSGYSTVPVTKDGRAFIPIRVLIEEMGGTIEWNAAESKITIRANGKTIELWIGNKNIRVDGVNKTMDVAPYISETGRTMLPLRFVAENLGCVISWDSITQTVTISGYGIGDTPKVQDENNIPAAVPVLPTGIPSSIPAPSISNLQLLKDDSGVPYFRLEVTVPASVLALDQQRPADGWVNLEIDGKIDDGEWGVTGGGGGHLDVFADDEYAVPGRTNTFYITFDVEDEGGLTETIINARKYTYRLRFDYTYYYGDGETNDIYSPWSNELSGQSESYYKSVDE